MSPLLLFVSLLLNGLGIGAIYALIALGFTLLWNTVQLVNFAQGDFTVIAMFLYLTCAVFLKLPLFVSVTLAIVGAAAAGFVLERVALRRVIGADPLAIVVVTLGVDIIISNGAKLVYGPEPFAVPHFLGGDPLRVLGAVLTRENVWIIGITLLAAVGFWWFTQFTFWGKAVRAISQDRDAAWLMGINVTGAIGLTFGVSTGLAGLAGVLLAPIIHVSADVGLSLLIKSFIAAVIGGFGNYLGAIVGGFLIGGLDVLTAFYVSSDYRDVISFALLILVLLLRPSGLFGRAQA